MVRFLGGCLLGAILGVLLVMAVGTLVFVAFFPKQQPLSLPPAPTVVSGESALIVYVSEAYANEEMVKVIKARSLPVENTALDVRAPDQAQVSMTMNLPLIGAVNPVAKVRFSVNNGQLAFDVSDINVSGLNIPQNLVQPIVDNFVKTEEAEINARIQEGLAGTGLRLIGVEATDNALIFRFGR